MASGVSILIGTLSVRQGAAFRPMVHVSPAAAAAGDGVGGFVRVEAFVDLADPGALDFKPEVGRELGREGVFAGPGVFQPFDDGFPLLRFFVVQGVGGDGRLFDGGPATHVHVPERRRRRNPERQPQIPADADDDDPVPRLRNPVSLEKVEIREQIVSRLEQRPQNRVERLAFVGRLQPADVFRQKPHRLAQLEHPDPVLVKRTECPVDPFLLPDLAEVVARESERQPVDFRNVSENLQIQFPDIRANHVGGFFVPADVEPVGPAGGFVVVRRPRVPDGKRPVHPPDLACHPRSPRQPPRPAKQLTQPENHFRFLLGFCFIPSTKAAISFLHQSIPRCNHSRQSSIPHFSVSAMGK